MIKCMNTMIATSQTPMFPISLHSTHSFFSSISSLCCFFFIVVIKGCYICLGSPLKSGRFLAFAMWKRTFLAATVESLETPLQLGKHCKSQQDLLLYICASIGDIEKHSASS